MGCQYSSAAFSARRNIFCHRLAFLLFPVFTPRPPGRIKKGPWHSVKAFLFCLPFPSGSPDLRRKAHQPSRPYQYRPRFNSDVFISIAVFTFGRNFCQMARPLLSAYKSAYYRYIASKIEREQLPLLSFCLAYLPI